MGKTIRVSQRQTKSPYRTRRRNQKTANTTNTGVTTTTGITTSSTTVTPASPATTHIQGIPPITTQNVDTIADAVADRIRGEMIQVVGSNRPLADQDNSATGTGINVSNTLSLTQPQMAPTQITSINDSLGFHVSQQIQDKIVNGEYIDLGILLDRSNTPNNNQLSLDASGQLVVKPKMSKPIFDINTWLDAFIIYTSIYTTVHKNDYQGLLKYMYNIKLGAGRSNGWRDYDQQFRLKKAHSPATSWAVIDQELWLLYMHESSKLEPLKHSAMGKCFLFNNTGRCTRPHCKYLHICAKCGGHHPALHCINTRFNQSNIATNVNSMRFGQPNTNTNGNSMRFSQPNLATSVNRNFRAQSTTFSKPGQGGFSQGGFGYGKQFKK